jgi:guanine nucleotide-binding protein subunit beta-2-like 1 protein
MAPKGQLMASGGNDGKVMLWQINDGEYMKQIPIGSPIFDIAFSPQRFWIAIATETRTKVYDLTTSEFILDYEPERLNLTDEKKEPGKKLKSFATTSVAWSKNGNLLYAGYADNNIRVFELVQDAE